MEVREAVKIAKNFVVDVLSEENVTNIGLEEVEYENGFWRITIGFSRPWNSAKNALTALTGEPVPKRTYRVITIEDKDRRVVSMMQRDKEQ